MKKFKGLIATALIASVLFGATGCGVKKFEAVSKKDFINALEDVADAKDYDSVSDPEDIYDYSYYSEYLDAYELLDRYEISEDVEYQDGDTYYYFIEFGDDEDAMDFFERYIYDVFDDVKSDGDFEGKSSTFMNDDYAYVIVHGESDSEDFYDDDIVGGFFVRDGVFVAVFTLSDKDSKIEDVNDFLKAIGYPKV